MSGVSSNIATTPEAHELLAHFQRQPKLMDNLRKALQARRYSKSTEKPPIAVGGMVLDFVSSSVYVCVFKILISPGTKSWYGTVKVQTDQELMGHKWRCSPWRQRCSDVRTTPR